MPVRFSGYNGLVYEQYSELAMAGKALDAPQLDGPTNVIAVHLSSDTSVLNRETAKIVTALEATQAAVDRVLLWPLDNSMPPELEHMNVRRWDPASSPPETLTARRIILTGWAVSACMIFACAHVYEKHRGKRLDVHIVDGSADDPSLELAPDPAARLTEILDAHLRVARCWGGGQLHFDGEALRHMGDDLNVLLHFYSSPDALISALHPSEN